MVFEDDLKKTDRKRRSFGWVFKLIFFICVLIVICIGALSMVGGKGDSLKNGAAQYLTIVSGMETEIQTVNNISFFPKIIIDIGGVVFKSVDHPSGAASVKEIYIAMPFWSTFIGRARFETMEIKNIKAKSGVWGVRPLDIRKVILDPKGDKGKPAFILQGLYGDESFDIYAELKRNGGLYGVQDGGALQITLGGLNLKGSLLKAHGGGLSLDFDEIGVPEKVASGRVRFVRGGGGWEVTSTLLRETGKIESDLKLNDNISGNIYSPSFDLADLGGDHGLIALYDVVSALLSDPDSPLEEIDLARAGLDVDVEFAKITSGEDYVGKLAFNVTGKGGVLNAGPFKGVFHGGQLGGSADLNAQELPARLDVTLDVKGLDYTEMKGGDENLSGEADLHVNLKGEGKTYKALWNSLDGAIALIGGEGHFKSAAMELWGTGLLTTMIPGLRPESEETMNCMIAMFKVEDGIARSDTVFMDMKHLTIVGEGEINLPETQIDLLLKPDPKGISLGDLSVPVRVKGSLFSPSINADRGGLGRKLGELFLGTINPAFWVYSLTDLGLSEDHPCRAYIDGEKGTPPEEEAPEPEKAVNE